LQGGDGAFEGAQAALVAFFARFLAALVFGQHPLEFEHAIAQFAVFFLKTKIVLYYHADDFAHGRLAVEHGLLTVGNGAEDIAQRLRQQCSLGIDDLPALVGAQCQRRRLIAHDALWRQPFAYLLVA
jgi:hypothetical protein